MDDRTGKICNGYIPTIIAKCGVFLKDEGKTRQIFTCYTHLKLLFNYPTFIFYIFIATSTEGIFRISGNAKRLSMLQTIFDNTSRQDEYGLNLDWQGYTVHDASNIMRRFLNYLPEPVITYKYQPLFKNTLGLFPASFLFLL